MIIGTKQMSVIANLIQHLVVPFIEGTAKYPFCGKLKFSCCSCHEKSCIFTNSFLIFYALKNLNIDRKKKREQEISYPSLGVSISLFRVHFKYTTAMMMTDDNNSDNINRNDDDSGDGDSMTT